MKGLILSRNTPFFRPNIFLTVPESLEEEELNQIPSLMDLYEKGFFIHMLSGYKSANLLFEIPSKYGRGQIEKLLISVVVDSESKINTSLMEILLEEFVVEFKRINEAYKAFYVNSKIYEGDQKKVDEIQTLLRNYYKSFPEEDVIYERKDAKVLIFGLSYAGKTTIIRCRRKSLFKNILPTISVDISRILVNNVSLLTYDTPGHPKFQDLWKPYLKGQDGLIFVLDITDTLKFSDARELLHFVANQQEMKELPLLILFNKVDIKEPDIDSLVNEMEISKLNNRPIKYFLTSAIKNVNIDEAFNWFALKISERVTPSPKSEIGVIFSSWDENIGIKIIAVHPTDAFDDPELIAIRCFSTSQFIFGGEEFKRTSVILPLPHLKAKAGIFFDYILDESIRGGMLPLSLVIYYNEDIPSGIIDQFNIFIFEKFAQIKGSYLDKAFVLKNLKEIYNAIINMLISSKSTLQVLKLAEVRYRSLFKAARDAFVIIDSKSGIIVDANDQAVNLFLMPLENLIGLHSAQIKLAGKHENFKDIILRQVRDDDGKPIVIGFKGSQEQIVQIEISTNEVQIGGQNLIQCILRDITERKLTEKKLKDSENKYQHLFENSPFSIILINQKSEIIDLNPAMEKLIEYERDELINKKFTDISFVHENHLNLLLHRFKMQYSSYNLPVLDIQLRKKNDDLIWARVQTSTVKMDEALFFQIMAYDITDQIEVEQDIKNILKYERILARISSRFVSTINIDSAINESIRDMGLLTNSIRVYLYLFNNAETLSSKRYEWCGESVTSQIDKLPDIRLNNFPWLLNKLEEYDYVYVNDVGKLPSEANSIKTFMEYREITSLLIYPIRINEKISGFLGFDNIIKEEERGDEKFIFLGIISEILGYGIERKKADIALHKSEENLHTALDRSQFYKELFVQDVKKIFDNIQSNLEGFSLDNFPERIYKVDELVGNTKRHYIEGVHLVSIIQKLTQLEETNLPIEKVEINSMINEVVNKIYKNYRDKKIIILIETPSHKFLVYANEFLKDVIENLLISSIKYNDKKSIEIKIVINTKKINGTSYITMEFVDNEIEISAIRKETILQIEKRQNNKLRGVLLGFLLIERILDRINGKIWVEGNKFVVQIPEASY